MCWRYDSFSISNTTITVFPTGFDPVKMPQLANFVHDLRNTMSRSNSASPRGLKYKPDEKVVGIFTLKEQREQDQTTFWLVQFQVPTLSQNFTNLNELEWENLINISNGE